MPESQEPEDAENVAESGETQDEALTSAGATQSSRKRLRTGRNKSPGPSETRTVAKRKGKRGPASGSLSGLLNMPLDIFFQVAAHLHPLDMLNLSRTSKSLRSIMLSKSNRAAWIASFASVEGLPRCPPNMSEPLHSALLFDHYCFLCGVDRAKWVDYAIRLRLCKACYKANIFKGFELLEDEMDIFETLPLFPCETGSDYEKAERFTSKERRTIAQKYYAFQVHATIDKYNGLKRENPEAASRFVAESLFTVNLAHAYAVMVLAWIKGKSLTKALTNIQILSDRKATIIERLHELGYTENDFPDGEHAWEKLMNQPKPLTDRIWNNLLPKLEEQLTLEQERRTREAFVERVSDRLDLIVPWYDEYVKENLTDAERNFMPNLCDARELPSLLALAESNDAQGELAREAFLEITDQVLVDTEEYKAHAKCELADLLRRNSACEGLELEGVPADDVLQRFCAYFQCVDGCNPVVDGCPYLTFEQLHAHWRGAHPENPWLRGDEDDALDNVEVPSFWPYTMHSAPSVGKRALEAVGIPLDTPREVLDRWTMEGRLFCACEHPAMPLPEQMSWGKLLAHLLRQTHEHEMRANEMECLHGKHNPNHVLLDNHSLAAGAGCCVTFLPAGADTAAASARTTASDAVRAQIAARLATRPEPGAVPVCRICKGLTRKSPWQVHRRVPVMRLPARAEEVVWHLQSCHGKEFEKRDILFVDI